MAAKVLKFTSIDQDKEHKYTLLNIAKHLYKQIKRGNTKAIGLIVVEKGGKITTRWHGQDVNDAIDLLGGSTVLTSDVNDAIGYR